MSDDLRNLAQGLLQKLQEKSFTNLSFSFTEQEFANSGKKNSYKSVSGNGRKENIVGLTESFTEEEKAIELEMEFGPQPGDNCPELPVYYSETGDEKTLTFSEEDPKVYLLDF